MAAESVAMIPIRDDQPTPMNVIQLAISQGADVDRLTKLFELQERWEANEARKAFNAAMAEFKQNPPTITKNKHVKVTFKEGGSMEYDHATLDHVCEQVTKALSGVGISHKWSVKQADGQITVSCILTHEMGHSESTSITGAPDVSGKKNPIQSIGSSISYLERYTLLAATGLAAEDDDDGHGAGKPIQPTQHMPEGSAEEWLDAIRATASFDELKTQYADAQKAAQKYSDNDALRRFGEAKNEQYRKLAKKAGAQ